MEVNSVVYFASDDYCMHSQFLGTEVDQLLAIGKDHCILLKHGSVMTERVFSDKDESDRYCKRHEDKIERRRLEDKAKLPFLLRWLEW